MRHVVADSTESAVNVRQHNLAYLLLVSSTYCHNAPASTELLLKFIA